MKRAAKSFQTKRQAVSWAAVVWLIIFFLAPSAWAMRDPDQVYCEALGYQFFEAQSDRGPVGVCKLADEQLVNASDFFTGLVALEHSFCARQGYEAKQDNSGLACRGCLVCVLPDGSLVEAIDLMDISFDESVCGDGHCGTMQNFSNCPQDCPSGGEDDFCDGVADKRCDPDCVEYGGSDPDCPGLFVEIEPGTCPKPRRLRPQGWVRVALLGTAGLDVNTIQRRSIRLSRPGTRQAVKPRSIKVQDVATPRIARNCACHRVAGDQQPDLLLRVRGRVLYQRLGLQQLQRPRLVLQVRAKLQDGQKVAGRSCAKSRVLAPQSRQLPGAATQATNL